MAPRSSRQPPVRWQPAPHIRSLDSGDLVIVLCLRSGAYWGLTGSAAAMWSGIASGQDPSSLCAHLASVFDVGHERLAADLDQFLADCHRRGLIRPVSEAKQPDAAPRTMRRPRILRRLPPALHAWLARLRTSTALAIGGLPSAYARAGARATIPPEAMEDPIRLDDLLAAFRRAERYVISRRGRNDCLPRSLALFSFLRERGCAIRHVIGVCTSPFVAHAWVEVENEPLLNQPHEVARFRPLAVLQ